MPPCRISYAGAPPNHYNGPMLPASPLERAETPVIRAPHFSYGYAARRCQRINRDQQMPANFLAAATRAIFAPERFRMRW